MSPVLGQPDVHQCWAITDMYERKICIVVTVMTHCFCQLICRPAQSQRACLVSWANLLCISVGQLQDMSERQACIGATVVTPGCCQLFLQSSSEPESMFPVLGQPDVHQCWAITDMYERKICIGVTVTTVSCFCRAAVSL